MKDKFPQLLKEWSVWLSAVVGVFGYPITRSYITNALIGTQIPTHSVTPFSPLTPSPITTVSPPNGDISSLAIEIQDLQNDVDALRQRVNGLSQQPSPSTTQTTQYQTEIQSLDGRIKVIEQVILENPERSLSIPLLSRDIDNTKKEMERLYDLFKWFIGFMFTMILSLLGLAVSNFFKKPEKTKETDSS